MIVVSRSCKRGHNGTESRNIRTDFANSPGGIPGEFAETRSPPVVVVVYHTPGAHSAYAGSCFFYISCATEPAGFFLRFLFESSGARARWHRFAFQRVSGLSADHHHPHAESDRRSVRISLARRNPHKRSVQTRGPRSIDRPLQSPLGRIAPRRGNQPRRP